jgi:hypothetical protein
MARKTVLRTQTVDGNTGEVKEMVSVTKEVKNTEKFLLAYMEDIGKLIGCTKGEITIVLACLQFVDYNTNELVLTPVRRSKICAMTKMTKDSFYTTVGRLYKKNIFIRENNTVYLNPKLFFRGKDIEREKWFSIHLNYKILDNSDLDKTGNSGLYKFCFSKTVSATTELVA